MKKMLGLTMAASLALTGLVGCSGSQSAGQPQQAPQNTPVTLKFWNTMDPSETKVLQTIVDDFMKQNPNIKIDMQNVPFSDAQSKFKIAAQAGDGPDVLRCEIAWTPEFAALGLLKPIDDKVSEEDKKDYLQAPFNYNVYQGKIYGIPQVTDAPAMLYNKRLLKEAGVEPPKTMEEFKTAVKKLTQNGHYGFYLSADSYFFQPFLYAFGGGTITDSKEILINKPESIEALKFMVGLKNDKVTQTNFDFANQYKNMMTDFKDGKVAIIFNGPWATADILTGKEFQDPSNLGVAPIPAGPKGQGSPVGGHNYVIASSSKYPNEAYKFIEFMNKKENQVKLAKELRLLPTRKSAYEDPALKSDPIFAGFAEQMKVAKNRPVIPEGGQIFKDFTPQIEAVVAGKASPEQALNNVADAWTKLLKK
ncbi:extracellular solute-binding protein [Effusibacillus pohliae]|uniref:extracellular solute-binding protein n=1 Tax=Effusibacillus pohliae TaxID=232270 RepID=UPI00058DC297|nr:extracellular solute-binding protein [Effusibacillus pohliae]